MSDEKPLPLDGFAAMANENPFATITPQPPPTDPRIKTLLGRALLKPASLSPPEVQEMAASLVYHLLSKKRI